MAVGQASFFDPSDFKNMVEEINKLNRNVYKQIENDSKEGKALFGVSSKSLEEFKFARQGIKDQKEALDKLREEFGEGITETKRYRKIEERLKKDEIKNQRRLKTPLTRAKEQAKDAAATTRDTFKKYLGRDSYFGKTMSGVVGIFQSIGGFLSRQTATISKILGAGLSVAALMGIASFLESETFKKMLPNIKASIERIINAFSEGGILEGLKQIGRELKLLFDNVLETTGLKEQLDNFKEKLDNLTKEIEDIGRETLFASAVGSTFLVTRKLAKAAERLFNNLRTVADSVDDAGAKAIGAKGATRVQALTAMAKDKDLVQKFADKGIKLGPKGTATDIKTGKFVSNERIEEITKDFLSKGASGTRLAGFMKAIFKILPFATAALMGYQLKNILESKDSKDDKIQQMGGLIAGTLGATALGALGGMLGAAAGPLGILGGLVAGSIAGGFGGDIAGRQIAQYLLGQRVDDIERENPNPRGRMQFYTPSPQEQKVIDEARRNRGNPRGRAPTRNVEDLVVTDSLTAGRNPITMLNSNSDNSVKTSSTNLMMTSDNPIDPTYLMQTRLGNASLV